MYPDTAGTKRSAGTRERCSSFVPTIFRRRRWYITIKYLDMFAGIGGFRAGLTRAGGFQCIGHCEIDQYANASYCAIHNPGKEEVYYSDARTIDPKGLPDLDLICGGFPCHVVASSISFASGGRPKAHSFRCSSFPNRTRFAGLRFGSETSNRGKAQQSGFGSERRSKGAA